MSRTDLIMALGSQRLNEITEKIDNELLPAIDLVIEALERTKKQLTEKKGKKPDA